MTSQMTSKSKEKKKTLLHEDVLHEDGITDDIKKE